MSSKQSVKEFSFISYSFFPLNSWDLCTIPGDNVDEEKVGPKFEDGEEEKEEEVQRLQE